MKRVQHYVTLLMLLLVMGVVTNGNAQVAMHKTGGTSNKAVDPTVYASLKQKLIESGYKGSVSYAELNDVKGLEAKYNQMLDKGVKDQGTLQNLLTLEKLILSLDPNAPIKHISDKIAHSSKMNAVKGGKSINTGTQLSDAKLITKQDPSKSVANNKATNVSQAKDAKKQNLAMEKQLQDEYNSLLEQAKSDPSAKMKLLVVQQALDNLKKNGQSLSNTKN